MVSVIDRLNYRTKLLGTPKVKAFLNLIEVDTLESPQVSEQSEADALYYSGLYALSSGHGDEFIDLYNDFSRREPDERAPYTRDDYLLFVLVCCAEKFSTDKVWLNKVLNCRLCSQVECTQTIETFKSILRGDTQNTSNLTAIVVLIQDILKRSLPNSQALKKMYTEYMKEEFPLYRSDFLTITALRAIDIVISEADIAGDGKNARLKRFESMFLKRTEYGVNFFYYSAMFLIIGLAASLYIRYKDQMDTLNTIVGLLGLAGLSLPAVFKKEFIVSYLHKKIQKLFGYSAAFKED